MIVRASDELGDARLGALATDVAEDVATRCKHCGVAVEPDLHSCPFREDVGNDPSPYCNCCPDCAHQCAMDI